MRYLVDNIVLPVVGFGARHLVAAIVIAAALTIGVVVALLAARRAGARQ